MAWSKHIYFYAFSHGSFRKKARNLIETAQRNSQELAAHVNLRRYKKHPRGPKKKPTQRTAYKNGDHVSTAKIMTKKI
jgi:hypothetical protein